MNPIKMQGGRTADPSEAAAAVVADRPQRGWGHALASLTLAVAGWQAAPAMATELTFAPGALGLNGTTFSFDTLYGGEASVLANARLPDNSVVWFEEGYLSIGLATLNGMPVDTTGLGTDYSLYVHFSLSGTGAGQNASGLVELIAAEGVTTFDFAALPDWPYASAYAINSGATYTLATVDLTSWDAGATAVSPTEFDLWTTLTATLSNQSPTALTSSSAATTLVSGYFDHPAAGNTVLGGGAVIIITGGTDMLTFSSAVPEPSSWALMGAGVLVGGLSLRRRRQQG